MTNIPEMSITDINDLGIDMSMVKTCRTIRRLAKLDRIKLDENIHRSGLNKHLFSYIEYCGMAPIDYIKEYLSNLQPYMIVRNQAQEKQNTFLCVLDKMYLISLYIKIDTKMYDEIIVSFHEDYKRGIAKLNNLIVRHNPKQLVPVFADSIGSITDEGKVSIKVIVQRGMKILPLNMIGIKYGEVFIVRERDIELQLVEYCNQYIQDLYTSDLDLDFNQIQVFTMLQQISFTSYGRDTFSSISLLIDSLVNQNDSISKQTADFALVTFTQNLLLTNEQKEELSALLTEKYTVKGFKKIDEILERIDEALYQTPVIKTEKENETNNEITFEMIQAGETAIKEYSRKTNLEENENDSLENDTHKTEHTDDE